MSYVIYAQVVFMHLNCYQKFDNLDEAPFILTYGFS